LVLATYSSSINTTAITIDVSTRAHHTTRAARTTSNVKENFATPI
jgi:hypothetical protein